MKIKDLFLKVSSELGIDEIWTINRLAEAEKHWPGESDNDVPADKEEQYLEYTRQAAQEFLRRNEGRMTFEDCFRTAARQLGISEIHVHELAAELRKSTGTLHQIEIPIENQNTFVAKMKSSLSEAIQTVIQRN